MIGGPIADPLDHYNKRQADAASSWLSHGNAPRFQTGQANCGKSN